MGLAGKLEEALVERKLSKIEREARGEPGGSNVGRYKGVKQFAGPAGGAPKGSFPIDTRKRARAALAYARNAPNPAGIQKAVCKAYPDFGTCKVATEAAGTWDGEWTPGDVDAILEWLMAEHGLELEDIEPDEDAPLDEASSKFEKLQAKLAQRKDVKDPAALAAWIGRKKFGPQKMVQMAAAGR